VLVGGALYLSNRTDSAAPATTFDARRIPAPGTAPIASQSGASQSGASQSGASQSGASKSGDVSLDSDIPSPADTDRVARLLGDARRLAYDGNFNEAKAALDKAEAILPGSGEIAQMRREIDEISRPEAQLALQLQRARSAIAQSDREGAEKALAAAERLSPQASEIAKLRQQLQDAEQKQAERSHRIAGLLGEMRQAIARHDLAAAGRALNEAERLDVRDPAIDPARIELAHAQDVERKAQQ